MNSFDEILGRMKQSLGGRFSVIEGTFAGDILQAVANELARVYSQEIDTMSARAFVTSAAGEWLDAACADYGMARKENESDDELRARTLSLVRMQASSGNEAHYRLWATELDGVAAAYAIGKQRGPGTVDVYIRPADESAGQALLDAVSAHIAGLRPVCVDVKVHYAQPQALAVAAELTLANGATPDSVSSEFGAAFDAYLRSIALTEYGGLISLTRVAGILMDCTGVVDANCLTIEGAATSYVVPNGKYCVPGALSMTRAATL